MSDPFYVTCHAGLCNRLRVLFSYRELATTEGRPFIFKWDVNANCVGLFSDYFESLPDVLFGPGNGIVTSAAVHGWPAESEFKYKDLKLIPSVKALVREQLHMLGVSYKAIHVRRTDLDGMLTRLAWRSEKLETFFDYIETDDQPFWLACDHRNTQQIFRRRYGDRAHFQVIDSISSSRRQTGLQESIVDLYMCIAANSFAGTPYSSFSEFIRQHVNLLSLEDRRKLIQP